MTEDWDLFDVWVVASVVVTAALLVQVVARALDVSPLGPWAALTDMAVYGVVATVAFLVVIGVGRAARTVVGDAE